MSPSRPSRRRFIAIAAAAVALPRLALAREFKTFTWRGIALGAEASLTIEHDDAGEANAAIEAVLAEVARLETIFSLSRPDSALSRLNKTGVLDPAPLDVRMVVGEALRLSALSDGAFDPTIQPLWTLYAEHFASRDADPRGPDPARIAATREIVGWQHCIADGSRIRLDRKGMALTLNGIAQGYITDRAGEVLKTRGFTHVLVDLGEQLALGPKRDGARWRVGIADPAAPGVCLETVAIDGGAVATSGGYGCHFDHAGRFSHLIDPRTGVPVAQAGSVTVVAASACRADGLSTAIAVAPAERVQRLLTGGARAYVVVPGARQGRWIKGEA